MPCFSHSLAVDFVSNMSSKWIGEVVFHVSKCKKAAIYFTEKYVCSLEKLHLGIIVQLTEFIASESTVSLVVAHQIF